MSESNLAASGDVQPCVGSLRDELAAVRNAMQANAWGAVIFPTGDPHISEYPSQHWCTRAWVSGFTGSAGTLVVLRDCAALWTDGRYYIQATQQLASSGIDLQRAADLDCPKPEAWLCEKLAAGDRVVCDGRQLSAEIAETMRKALTRKEIALEINTDPLAGDLWRQRPPLPSFPAFVHNAEFVGQSVSEKLGRVRECMGEHGASHYLISSVDAVAWLLNIRGNDIPSTPVVLAYVLIAPGAVTCFIDAAKCPPVVDAHLEEAGVVRCGYDAVYGALATLERDSCVLLDPKRTCTWLREAIPETCQVVDADDPVQKLKAVKNSTEVAHLRDATERDCAALAQFLAWFDGEMMGDGVLTERAAAEHLERLRCGHARYLGPSFETIPAFGEHGAVMHYSATLESDIPIERHSFFLLDTGSQYLDGTTDITRTIACGALSAQQKRDFTLVLKAHIAIARAVFVRGTTGPHLDILARGIMAREGLNYRCGTGHGIGYCLCVHEGPHGISNGNNTVPLEPGMLLTNEPGVYREGEYGIRLENTLLVREHATTDSGSFLAFEPVSYCPLDTRPVLGELLTDDEREWLNHYQAEACRRLSPRVDSETQKWLERACSPLGQGEGVRCQVSGGRETAGCRA